MGRLLATFTGSQGPFWWILQMCMALAALFSIIVAASMAYKMMVKNEPLDVMKLFKPLVVSIILLAPDVADNNGAQGHKSQQPVGLAVGDGGGGQDQTNGDDDGACDHRREEFHNAADAKGGDEQADQQVQNAGQCHARAGVGSILVLATVRLPSASASIPGTLDFEKLAGYRRAGINRLSMGLQSACDKELAMLGRIHNFSKRRGLSLYEPSWI